MRVYVTVTLISLSQDYTWNSIHLANLHLVIQLATVDFDDNFFTSKLGVIFSQGPSIKHICNLKGELFFSSVGLEKLVK